MRMRVWLAERWWTHGEVWISPRSGEKRSSGNSVAVVPWKWKGCVRMCVVWVWTNDEVWISQVRGRIEQSSGNYVAVRGTAPSSWKVGWACCQKGWVGVETHWNFLEASCGWGAWRWSCGGHGNGPSGSDRLRTQSNRFSESFCVGVVGVQRTETVMATPWMRGIRRQRSKGKCAQVQEGGNGTLARKTQITFSFWPRAFHSGVSSHSLVGD